MGMSFTGFVAHIGIIKYTSSHNHGSVKNGCISNRIVTFQIVRHFPLNHDYSKKSPTRPTERTPKPEYLIALVSYLGVRW